MLWTIIHARHQWWSCMSVHTLSFEVVVGAANLNFSKLHRYEWYGVWHLNLFIFLTQCNDSANLIQIMFNTLHIFGVAFKHEHCILTLISIFWCLLWYNFLFPLCLQPFANPYGISYISLLFFNLKKKLLFFLDFFFFLFIISRLSLDSFPRCSWVFLSFGLPTFFSLFFLFTAHIQMVELSVYFLENRKANSMKWVNSFQWKVNIYINFVLRRSICVARSFVPSCYATRPLLLPSY